MKLIHLDKPQKSKGSDIIFGAPIPPLSRLKTFSDVEFEEMVNEWAYDYLSNKYTKVFRIGGAGDKGRDVIGYLDGDGEKIDIYQCKHYNGPLYPSQFWLELGKLCYYTYVKDYNIPINYYIVASQGIGPKLRELLENPKEINKDLILNWDKHCKTKITGKKNINLDKNFKIYIEEFDFAIVKDIQPIELINQYEKTKWYKYRFGGGLKKRPKPERPPESIDPKEKKMYYIDELLKAYCQFTDGKVKDLETLKSDTLIFDHFTRQREDYYSAQSLKRFSRDEFVDEPYKDVKEEVYRGVIDISLNKYKNGFERVNTTLSEARKISIDINELGKVYPSDKCGMCHELVNDEKMKWVNLNEEY